MVRTKRRLAAVLSAVILALTAMLCLMPYVSADTVTVGDFTVTGGTENSDYKYENNVLTIRTATPLTISGTTTTDRIEVENGISANITLDNVNIDVSAQNNTAAFKIADDSWANITVTLVGTNKLKSGLDCAGLQKNGQSASGTLEIKGAGSLEATSGTGGAGIGGGFGGLGTNITVSGGTVIAKSWDSAGIGGGYGSVGSNITVRGGTVTANSGYGAGIGGGNFDGFGTNITVSGGTVTAKSEYGAGIGGGDGGNGSDIRITGGSVKAESTYGVAIGGNVYPAVTPTLEDGTTPVYLLEIENPNNETVLIDNSIYTPVNHKAADSTDGNLYAYLTGENHIVKVGDKVTAYIFDGSSFSKQGAAFIISGTNLVYGTDYTYPADTGVLTVKSEKAITISNTDTSTSTTDRIEVENGISANITLDNVNIDVSTQNNTAAFKIADDSWANVTVTLVGTNKLKSGLDCAGLQKNGQSASGTLEIKGAGSLEATSGSGGAGIGGNFDGFGTNITVSGGTVTAIGVNEGAGIGGGAGGGAGGGNGSNITISGGTVTAKSELGAGIGGGFGGTGTNITISGGTITAKSAHGGAGIGGGTMGLGSDIRIAGGSVKAESTDANAIGGGGNQPAVTPTLEDGTTPVYLLEIENPDGKPITINNKSYPTSHNGEKKIYAYLPAGTASSPNTVTVGTQAAKYYYDTAAGNWVEVCAHNNVRTDWSYDSTGHWHICNDCSGKADFAQHTEDSGTVTVQPTETTKGVKTYSCKICRYVIRTKTIPATGTSGGTSRPTTPSTSSTNTTANTAAPKLTVKVKTNGKTAVLSWNKLKEADNYVIYQYKNGKYVKIKTTANTSVTFKNLTNGKTYKFMVRYTVNGRTYSTGIEGKVTVKVYYKPIAKASAESTRIKLSWKAVPNAEKYAVYKYADGKAVKLAETKKLSVIIKKLEPDTEYQYIVRAYADGKWTEMKKSDIVTVKTKA